MSYTATYENRHHESKPISILLTIFIMIAGITMGSILAIVYTWTWIVFAVIMLAIQALRLRIVSLGIRFCAETGCCNGR